MNNKFFDVLVAKEYLSKQNDVVEPRTAWNKIGRAWMSKSNESMSFELFLMPNQRYVIQLTDRRREYSQEKTKIEGAQNE
jgi:hypothetical protein